MTPLSSEGIPFSVSSVSCSCAEQVIPASSDSASLWQPLDELVYAWATFCTQTMHHAALIVTGIALHALSWEQTALRSYTLAQQSSVIPHAGRPISTTSAALLERTLHDLSQARDRWHRAITWLDRLANNADDPLEPEALDSLRTLYRSATEQQRRLWLLTGEIQQEQQRLLHRTLDTLSAPIPITIAEGGTHA